MINKRHSSKGKARLADFAKRLDQGSLMKEAHASPQQFCRLQGNLDAALRKMRSTKDQGSEIGGMHQVLLFVGPNSKEKTMAAAILGEKLSLDLYRIDLSKVVSKYIGETEKYLSRLFDRAENTGAILFFDEADALFGKRSEVKNSHDRYAKNEIFYLMNEIENYGGLVIISARTSKRLHLALLRLVQTRITFSGNVSRELCKGGESAS